MHSELSLGEHFDIWHAVRDGQYDVVIGPRGALFAPQPDLGLVIIDEEHEWTYKQQEGSPRYHARRAAEELCRLTGAVLVLGSATPDVESHFRAQEGATTGCSNCRSGWSARTTAACTRRRCPKSTSSTCARS